MNTEHHLEFLSLKGSCTGLYEMPHCWLNVEQIHQGFFLLISGQAHEIHPPSKDQPGIVVHICEDPEGYNPGGMMPIVQTRCPERKT